MGEWPHLKQGDERFNAYNTRGGLGPNYGGMGNRGFGPEFAIGNVLGDHFDETVLLVKAAFGGNSLGGNFLSPELGRLHRRQVSDKSHKDLEKGSSYLKPVRSQTADSITQYPHANLAHSTVSPPQRLHSPASPSLRPSVSRRTYPERRRKPRSRNLCYQLPPHP
jgi:hypothetical protein